MISESKKTLLSDLGAYLSAAAKLEPGAEIPVDVSENPDWSYIDKICSEQLAIASLIDREHVSPGFVILKTL